MTLETTGQPINPQIQNVLAGATEQAPPQETEMMPSPSVLSGYAPGSWQERLAAAAPTLAKPFHQGFADDALGSTLPTNPDGTPKVGAVMNQLVSSALGSMKSQFQRTLEGQDHTQAMTPPPPPPSRSQQAINALTGSLGDAAAGMQGPGGARTGIAETLKARGERTRQEQNDRILTAKSNAEMIHQQALTHKLGEDAMKESASTGQAGLADVMNAERPGIVLGKDLDSDKLHELARKPGTDPTEVTAFHTGNRFLGNDANGIPQYRATYTVVSLGGPMKPGPENAKKIGAILGQEVDPETMIPAAGYNALMQQVHNKEAMDASRDLAFKQAKISKHDIDVKAEQTGYSQDPDIMNAIANNGGALKGTVAAYDVLPKVPGFLEKHPNFMESYALWAGHGKPENFDKMQEEVKKELNKTGELANKVLEHPETVLKSGELAGVIASLRDRINNGKLQGDDLAKTQRALKIAQDTQTVETNQAGAMEISKAEAKKRAAARGNNPTGKVGAEFIATLPVGRAKALQAISEGSIAVNPAALERTDKGQAFMDDIYAAYPDFQAFKGETWPKAYNEYMGSGATAKAKINYNTALQHLQDVYDNSGAEGFVMGTDMYRRRQAALPLVINEVGKAVKTGVVTEGEYEEIRDGMGGWTPDSRRTRVQEVGKLLRQKIGEFQQAFNDAAPSAQIKTPMLISPQAQASWDYIQRGGGAPIAPKAPEGATFIYHDAQGNVKGYAVGGKFVPAEAQ